MTHMPSARGAAPAGVISKEFDLELQEHEESPNMSSLQRRIETLEKSRSLIRPADAQQGIVRAALEQLSDEDLELLSQGPPAEPSERATAALAAYTSALERECQWAGFRSIAELERRSSRRKTPPRRRAVRAPSQPDRQAEPAVNAKKDQSPKESSIWK